MKPTLMTPLESRTLFSADYTATILATPGVYLRGETVPLTVQIKNVGTSGSIFPSQHTVVLSTDQVYGDGDDIAWAGFNTGGLARGQVFSQALNPPVRTTYAPGSYYIAVKVDKVNTVNESNESNVFFTPAPVVIVPSDDLPAGPITGTSGNDVILLQRKGGKFIVTFNGVARAGAIPDHLFIDAGAGNDKVIADGSVTTRLQVTGNVGADTLVGGSAKDELSGSYGMDRILGGGGDDFLLGGAVNDYLNGEAGNDLMIAGGGNDRLVDESGRDYFIGGEGNDVILARDTANTAANGPDTISGQTGNDGAQVDTTLFPDAYTSIEYLIL